MSLSFITFIDICQSYDNQDTNTRTLHWELWQTMHDYQFYHLPNITSNGLNSHTNTCIITKFLRHNAVCTHDLLLCFESSGKCHAVQSTPTSATLIAEQSPMTEYEWPVYHTKVNDYAIIPWFYDIFFLDCERFGIESARVSSVFFYSPCISDLYPSLTIRRSHEKVTFLKSYIFYTFRTFST